MKFISNVIERIKSMIAGRRNTEFFLSVDDIGIHKFWLTLENTKGEDHLKWNEILSAKAFKRDLFSVD